MHNATFINQQDWQSFKVTTTGSIPKHKKTLKDRLVRSKLRNESEVETGSFKCNSKRCEVFNYIEPGSKFKSCDSKIV